MPGWQQPAHKASERRWAKKSPGREVWYIQTAVREHLLEVAAKIDEPPSPERELEIEGHLRAAEEAAKHALLPRGPRTPEQLNGSPFEIKDHQREALNAWQAKGDFQGIFDLATGAGKTITSIYGIVQMSKAVAGLTVVIAVPYQNLADQWCEVLGEFNITPLQCYVSKANWIDELRRRVLDVRNNATPFEAIVVVNRTLVTAEFQDAILSIPPSKLLWIGDECHHHGSEALASALPQNARYRIGLSATPIHYLDDQRNARLKAYYGDVVFTYSLERAIREHVLTPYEYFPEIVSLTDEEADEFVQLSDEIARQFARGDKSGGKPGPGLTALLMKRARIVGSATNKLSALERCLAGQKPISHTLFYCGDGRVDVDSDYGDGDGDGDVDEPETISLRQIEAVSRLVDRIGWKVSHFTSREGRREREQILQAFRVGLIDGMVAIRCLDEGIDVPACSTAYILASSRVPRQFIQRRGRILRRSPGKKLARIFDFVVVLPEGAHDGSGAARKLIQAELKRVAEFASLAVNRFKAYEQLRTTLTRYDLEHLL